MEYLFIGIAGPICFLLRSFIIEYYRNERFKNFPKLYEGEDINELSKYEKNSKNKIPRLNSIKKAKDK